MTNEQKFIAANAAYIEELIRDVDRLEKSRDYVTNELNRECNKMVAAEKELKEAQVKNLDLEVELEDTQKQLKAANESSEGLTQDVIQSEKNIADLREECDRLTNSNKALKLALELKQLNGPDVSELKKEIRQLQDQNDELTRMCAPDPDIPTEHVKTAEEIAEWCGSGACAVCNHMQIDDEGYGECDLEIYRVEPCFWSRHVIATLDRIMTFESQADTIVEDTEDDG